MSWGGRVTGWLLTAALLGGCATVTPTQAPDPSAWAARQTQLQQVQSWTIVGRISVTREDQSTGQRDGWHANLRWMQRNAQDYQLELVGPLGQGRVEIGSDAQGVWLRTADGQQLRAADPDELLSQATGASLPISGLLYWVRGLPTPNDQAQLEGDSAGFITGLQQAGWQIRYLRYAEHGGLQLPERLDAQRGEVQVKLAISEWQL